MKTFDGGGDGGGGAGGGALEIIDRGASTEVRDNKPPAFKAVFKTALSVMTSFCSIELVPANVSVSTLKLTAIESVDWPWSFLLFKVEAISSTLMIVTASSGTDK
jgi:hypothetical protein